MTARPRTVGILVFGDAEVLDVCGPYEVFSVAGRRAGLDPFRVLLLAAQPGPVVGRHGFVFTPHATLVDHPPLDLCVVPGGIGTRPLLGNAAVVDWVRRQAESAELVLSVCTGALVLGVAGLLDGLEATTHHLAFEELAAAAPGAVIRRDRRMVDNGRLLLSAGVASGIELSLHVVARLLGREVAEEAARYIEYPWAGPVAGAAIG